MKFKILLLIIILPTFVFLLKPGEYWNMHDDMQIIRQLQMEKCFQDGQIPCRWTPDLGYGYGYPLFNFYPPLPYLIGQVFRVFGFSFVTTVKLTAILQIIASAFAIFFLAKIFFGPVGGLLSATFYAYAPYRSVNIYIRGAINEAWASVFFPLIFLYIYRLIESKKFSYKYLLLLSLSIAGLLLSHNPMALTFAPFALFWAIFWLVKKPKVWQKIKLLLLSGFIGLSLSAFFTLPVLFESKLVQIDSMFQNYYHYSVHFASFFQLFFSNFWGDGPSVWGIADQMPFMIGYLHWSLPILIALVSGYKLIVNQNRRLSATILLIVLFGFFATLMTHQKSGLIWQYFPTIQKIQFPWRFLNHASFFLSLSIGALSFYLSSKRYQKILIPLVVLAVIIINWSHLTPITHGPITDEQKLTGKAWNNQITSGIYDYLPKTAATAPKSPAQPIIDLVEPASVEATLISHQTGTDWDLITINLKQPAKITLARLFFPNLTITKDHQSLPFTIEPELGRPQIDLPSGTHQLYLKYHNTLIRTVANYLSLLAWIFTLWKLTTSKK